MERFGRLISLGLMVLLGCSDDPLMPLPPPAHPRVGWYVDVAGSPGGDGSASAPWDLGTAATGARGRVQPGDTIWLRAGVYGGSHAVSVNGAAGAPVVIRAFPGERVILDGRGTGSSTLIVDGTWVVVWGLELTNTDRNRGVPRADAVLNNSSHNAFVNLEIHDGGVALYSGRYAHDVQIYGCIIYDNGWQESDRGHGHGIYLKSDLGPVLVRGNVVFNQFGFGLHAYSDRGAGLINGVTMDGNISFDNGTLSNNSTSANLLLGGRDPADSARVINNLLYFAPGAGDYNVQVGYDTVTNGAMVMSGNTAIGGRRVLSVGFWRSARVTGNTLVGDSVVQLLNNSDTAGAAWSANAYFRDPLAMGWAVANQRYTFAGWRAATGLGTTDTASAGRPAANVVLLTPNAWEPGRATLAVLNWAGATGVSLDASGVLAPGDSFEVRNVQALHDAPLLAGVYAGGSITLPLGGVDPPVPWGMGSSPAPRTGPVFDVFLLTRVAR